MYLFKITTLDNEIFYQIAGSFNDCFLKLNETIKNPQIIEIIASFDTKNGIYENVN